MKFMKFLILISSSLILSGCLQDWDKTDLEQKVAAVKKIKNIHLEPIPDFPSFESFSYTANATRNPFESLIKTQKPVAPPEIDDALAKTINCLRPDRHRNKEALENFPLDSLKMVGTLSEQGDVWALITDPDGLIYRVQVNNYVGENFGKIIAIEDSQIDIREMHHNDNGCYIEREASLASAASTVNKK